MISQEVVDKLIKLFDHKVQLYEGKSITCGINQNISVRVTDKKNNKKVITALSINVTKTNQNVIVFYDLDKNSYTTWVYEQVDKTIQDIIRYRKTRPFEETTYKLILVYLFSTDYYYNFTNNQYYSFPQTLQLNRTYDIFTTLRPGKINNRSQITGKCKGGVVKIKIDCYEQYDVTLPFHKPTIEIFRTNKLTNNQFVFDNTTYINGDINSSLYSTYFTNDLVRRIGGYRHYLYLDTNYPHKALHYASSVAVDDFYQSSVTGTIMHQILSQEVLMYNLFPSFTDNFTICIYDYGINGKPDTNYYGLEVPPIQLRQDSFTNQIINIDLVTQNMGLSNLSTDKPIYLNYKTFLDKLNHNVYVNPIDYNEKYLITFKYETISKTQLNGFDDTVVYYEDNITEEFNDPINNNLNTFIYPHGSNDYLIVDKVVDNQNNVNFAVVNYLEFKYPLSIYLADNLNNLLIDENKIWNKEIVLNYIGGIGTGSYTFNSHNDSLKQLKNLYKYIDGNVNYKNNFIQWINGTFVLNPTKVITNYDNIIFFAKQHTNFPLFNLPQSTVNIYYGLYRYKDIIKNYFGLYINNNYERNPSLNLNFATRTDYVRDKNLHYFVPQHGSYFDLIKMNYWNRTDLRYFLFYKTDEFLYQQWNNFVNKIKSNQRMFYPVAEIQSNYTVTGFNSFYESTIGNYTYVPKIYECVMLGTNLNILEPLNINNITNPAFESFLITSIHPLVVYGSHPLANILI